MAGFSNLENAWAELASQYQNTQTDFETSLQQHNTDGQLDSTLANVQAEREERGLVQYMTDVNWFIDTSGSPDEFILNDLGNQIPNPEYNPNYGFATHMGDPIFDEFGNQIGGSQLPTIESLQPDGIINRWADPITFSLFSVPGLLGWPQPKEPATLYEYWDPEEVGWKDTYFDDITSNYSISEEPQEVDFFHSFDAGGAEQVGGFFANHSYPMSFFNGISDPINGTGNFGIIPGGTDFYSNTDFGNHPGPVDMFNNIKATGFTNLQEHKSPSQFKGVTEQAGVYDWNNTYMQGGPGSIYGIESPGPPTDPQQQDNMDNQRGVGFTAQMGIGNLGTQFVGLNDIPIGGGGNFGPGQDGSTNMYKGYMVGGDDPYTVDFFDGINSYYEAVGIDGAGIPGFTSHFNFGGWSFGSDDVGNSLYIDEESNTSISTGNWSMYHNAGINFISQRDTGNDMFGNIGFNGFTSGMTETDLQGIDESGINWNTGEDSITNMYYQILDGSILHTFSDSEGLNGLDFLGGDNSYQMRIGEGLGYDGVPGFHIKYNPGLYGGWSVENPSGDTKYKGVRSWNIYSETGGFGFDLDVNSLMDYSSFFDSLLPQQEEDGTIIPSIGVDFFDGKSLHPASDTNNGYYIQGFDLRYNPGLSGGWSSNNPEGDSKLLGLWNREGYDDQVLTSMWNGLYVDVVTNGNIQSNATINFNDIQHYEEPVFPGGYSEDNKLGTSHFVGDLAVSDDDVPIKSALNPDVYADNYNSVPNMYEVAVGTTDEPSPSDTITFTGISPSLFYFYSSKLENGLDAPGGVWAGQESNQGGAPSKQHSILYSDEDWNQKAGEYKYLGPNQPGSNFSTSDRFHIKDDMHNSGWRIGRIDSMTNMGLDSLGIHNLNAYGGPSEPYIVDHIGMTDDTPNYDNQEAWIPMTRIKKDGVRISKFLSSDAGTQFIANQELLGGFQLYKWMYDVGSTLLNVSTPKQGLALPMANFTRDTGIAGAILDLAAATTYTEYLDNRSHGLGMANIGAPSSKTYAERSRDNKPMMIEVTNAMENWSTMLVDAVWDLFSTDSSNDTPAADSEALRFKHQAAGINKSSGVSNSRNIPKSLSAKSMPLGNLGRGDLHTLMPIHGAIQQDVGYDKVSQNGMPFYFRDLRDNKLVVFRAYIEGLSETISPSWNSEVYVGRSEPVYTYGSTEREINFNLKLFAQTKDELNQIYTKMNRLTSMAYPAYKEYQEVVVKENPGDDTGTLVRFGQIGEKARMKPPLCKMRLGDLYGTKGDDTAEVTGFIKSLSYSYPDNSPWEIQEGYQVPKFIEVEMGYQVIHSTVPNLEFALAAEPNTNFYGINKTLFNSQ